MAGQKLRRGGWKQKTTQTLINFLSIPIIARQDSTNNLFSSCIHCLYDWIYGMIMLYAWWCSNEMIWQTDQKRLCLFKHSHIVCLMCKLKFIENSVIKWKLWTALKKSTTHYSAYVLASFRLQHVLTRCLCELFRSQNIGKYCYVFNTNIKGKQSIFDDWLLVL